LQPIEDRGEGVTEMKGRDIGIWSTAHWSLDLIGRTVAWILPAKALSEDDAYSMTGGAVVGTMFGALVGFALSDESRAMTTLTGAAIGTVLGACIGVMFGAFVQTIDDAIEDWISKSN
jgi:membrane protein YqaA with SNARE-associated domain